MLGLELSWSHTQIDATKAVLGHRILHSRLVIRQPSTENDLRSYFGYWNCTIHVWSPVFDEQSLVGFVQIFWSLGPQPKGNFPACFDAELELLGRRPGEAPYRFAAESHIEQWLLSKENPGHGHPNCLVC